MMMMVLSGMVKVMMKLAQRTENVTACLLYPWLLAVTLSPS